MFWSQVRLFLWIRARLRHSPASPASRLTLRPASNLEPRPASGQPAGLGHSRSACTNGWLCWTWDLANLSPRVAKNHDFFEKNPKNRNFFIFMVFSFFERIKLFFATIQILLDHSCWLCCTHGDTFNVVSNRPENYFFYTFQAKIRILNFSGT